MQDEFVRIKAQGRQFGDYVVNLSHVSWYDVQNHELAFTNGKTLNVAAGSHETLMRIMGFPVSPRRLGPASVPRIGAHEAQ